VTDHTAVLRPPGPVVEIARRLVDAGHETWCVGGAVRDALLGVQHLDWDLATSATPPQVRRLFRRTIPIGIEFGTVGVLDDAGTMHEVTTFRRDVQTDGRHAVVEFGASLDEDLARRDFTINAIAFDPIAHKLHDPFDGRRDLESEVVRAVGVASDRMREDRLRALRAIRFAARFDFAIERETWDAIVESAPFLSRLSAERVKQEIEKTMEQVACPSKAFRLWRDAGALAQLIPQLASISDVALHACDNLPREARSTRPYRRTLRIAVLFSDLDAKSAEGALKALRLSNHDIGVITALIDRWHGVGAEMGRALIDGAPSGEQLRRWAAKIGRLRIAPFLRFAHALWNAQRDVGVAAPQSAAVRTVYRRLQHVAFNDPIELADLALDGDDLRTAGIPPGKHVGKLLAFLLDRVLADPRENNREALLHHALEWSKAGGR
jgi:tRNA nucleotidyltransferase (CCA-adding enzyme)